MKKYPVSSQRNYLKEAAYLVATFWFTTAVVAWFLFLCTI